MTNTLLQHIKELARKERLAQQARDIAVKQKIKNLRKLAKSRELV